MNEPAKRPMIYKEAQECVDQINANLTNVRQLVVELHDRDGWTALGHASWTECVQKEFKQAERYIFYQYKAAEIELNVSYCTIVQLGAIPEGQLRPLSKLEPQQQRDAWAKAVETAPDGKVTAAHVSKVVKEMMEPTLELKPEPQKPVRVKKGPPMPPELIADSFEAAFDQMVEELKHARAMKWKETSHEVALSRMQELLIIVGQTGR